MTWWEKRRVISSSVWARSPWTSSIWISKNVTRSSIVLFCAGSKAKIIPQNIKSRIHLSSSMLVVNVLPKDALLLCTIELAFFGRKWIIYNFSEIFNYLPEFLVSPHIVWTMSVSLLFSSFSLVISVPWIYTKQERRHLTDVNSIPWIEWRINIVRSSDEFTSTFCFILSMYFMTKAENSYKF